tara:strand:+ start:20116 stop:20745 length:630 start_codon:yes stop_codon:yes gene_type:complete
MNEWEQPVTMQENRQKRQPHDFIWLVASLLVLVFGYLLFRQIYDASESLPFAQETILVFLGAVATIFLTAVLLNRQTELELSKEGRVLLFDQKNAIYMAAVEKIAEIVEEQRHDPQLIDELRVIGHKLAIVGSAPVIGAFRTVLDLLLGGLRDGELDNKDAEDIMHAVAEVTFAMRQDLLTEIGAGWEQAEREMIVGNSRRMERLDDLG